MTITLDELVKDLDGVKQKVNQKLKLTSTDIVEQIISIIGTFEKHKDNYIDFDERIIRSYYEFENSGNRELLLENIKNKSEEFKISSYEYIQRLIYLKDIIKLTLNNKKCDIKQPYKKYKNNK